MKKKRHKSMFGTIKEPAINFSLPEISLKAQEMIGKLSISGVQPKLSVKFDRKKGELITVAEGGEYILKPQTSFPHIPENEQCCMDIAQALGIDVPAHCLLRLTEGSFVYIVKRFDRLGKQKIHQEDFSQILGKKKYDGSVEQIGRKLKSISAIPGLDAQLFFERVVFNFLIGNGDAHLKNYSISHGKENQIRLTPAYDIVCSKLVIPDEEDSALAIHGKKTKLIKEDFDALADYLQIPPKVRYENFLQKEELMAEFIRSSKLEAQERDRFTAIIQERYRRLNFL
ncbi:MAG: HipA domain-containing protein [Candidatus Omnitrophota bacterium]